MLPIDVEEASSINVLNDFKVKIRILPASRTAFARVT